ncbi:MAG: inositol 2-dehydrogenase [Candidatus Promineifilaceae bacterium]
MTVGVGLIGAGRMGSVLGQHLATSVPGAAFIALAEPDAEAGQAAGRRFGVPHVYTNYAALLARDDVQAVVIATPTSSHVEVILAAAAAGKHIFTEKPLALTLAGCDQAIAAVEAAGVKLQVGFMRRFDDAYLAAKEQIVGGTIGRPVLFRSVSRDPWRTSLDYARREVSGGLIADMGVHDFDLARWLMGSEVERVSSEGGCLVFPELGEVGDIDNAVVNLRFANGAVGGVDLSRNAIYGYDIRTEVVGSEGSVFVGGLQGKMTWTLRRGQIAHDTIPGFMQRFGPAYTAEMQAFVRCLAEERPVAVSGADARQAAAIAIAATRSFDEGRPVALSEVTG